MHMSSTGTASATASVTASASAATVSLPRVLIEAARPRTLPAGLAPVLYGTAFAVVDGTFHLGAFLLAALGALAIQIGTNYANDYFDAKKGADTEARIGPRRATQAGLVKPSTMKAAFILAFVVAVLFGIGLVWRAGWPVVAIGVASVVCGVLYTGGPKPLGYLGLGDVFVLVFFGPVAVAGTHYVQALVFDPIVALAGVGPGLLSVAILVVNNLRDRHTDVVANKRTLAVRFGPKVARVEYALAVALGVLITVGVAVTRAPLAAVGILGMPMSLSLVQKVWTLDGAALNPLLGQTAKLLLVTTTLTALAMVLTG
jgi:1,4-dihydroxy-2-naphthoate octaprenyltransferase